jgi:hypothetical protein
MFTVSLFRLLKHSLLMMGSMALLACQSTWEAPATFGDPINQAIQTQLVNPSAPNENDKPTKGLDGAAAKSSIDNYEKSFESKPVTTGYPVGSSNTTGGGNLGGFSR